MMQQTGLPVILLLGAKSRHKPLEAVPGELNKLRNILFPKQNTEPKFELVHLPYFTRADLHKTLDQLKNRVAILHFAGHSSDEALMTDGETENPSGSHHDDELVYSRHICTHIQSWALTPSLVFLNGCHNSRQVSQFHQAGVEVVIATHRAIDDGQASAFAQEFYHSLFFGSQTSLSAAFEQAGAKALTENRSVRSIDIEALDNSDSQQLDWSLYARDEEQLSWVLDELLTHERPVRDEQGKLINPYRGLEAFREQDRSYFFGRRELTDELCDSIPQAQLYALWGASGSGKSSLINAGVIPKLRENNEWLILKIRPGGDPFRLLATEIALVFHPEIRTRQDEEVSGLIKQLKTDTFDWTGKVSDLLHSSGKQRLLIVIDQFEELFTQSDPETVKAYEAQLINLVNVNIKQCSLLLVMRADFLASALLNESFAHLLNQISPKLLPPMGKAELRAAIELPARKQRVDLEPSLTNALLDEVDNQPGYLPLLQYALRLLWDKHEDNRLRLEDYNQFGGLNKVLETRADEIFSSFPEKEQQRVRKIFLQLVQPGKGREDTRRRADFREFGDDAFTRNIVQTLADARLITTEQDKYDKNKAFAEVSHEALIRHWGRLQSWIEEDRDSLNTQIQISEDAKDWEDDNRDATWLLTGSRLVVAKEWLKAVGTDASELQATFIKASFSEQERQQKVQRNRLLGFIGVLMVVAAVAVWQAFSATKAGKEAREQQKRAELALSEANDVITFINFDLRDQLIPIVPLTITNEIRTRVTAYYRNLGDNIKSGEFPRQRAISLIQHADTLAAQGKLPEAEPLYREANQFMEQKANSDPSNTEWQRDLSVSFDKIGDILSAQGQLDEAKAAFEKSQTIRQTLADNDPSNTEWQRDLSASLIRIGDIFSDQGKLDEAKAVFEKGLAIAQKLADNDPSNTKWQHDLSASFIWTGDILSDQGKINDAKIKYEESESILQKLVDIDPTNAEWQRELSTSLGKIGDILSAQGQLDDAKAVFEKSLAIAQTLADNDPSNAGWQTDLVVSHIRIMKVAQQNNDIRSAHEYGAKALAALKPLAEQGLLHGQRQQWIGIIEDALKQLE